jgi:hypothetical protein
MSSDGGRAMEGMGDGDAEPLVMGGPEVQLSVVLSSRTRLAIQGGVIVGRPKSNARSIHASRFGSKAGDRLDTVGACLSGAQQKTGLILSGLSYDQSTETCRGR